MEFMFGGDSNKVTYIYSLSYGDTKLEQCVLGGVSCYFMQCYQERIKDNMTFEEMTEEIKAASLAYHADISRRLRDQQE